MRSIKLKIREEIRLLMKIKKLLILCLFLYVSLCANEKLIFGVNPYKSIGELQVIHAELIAYLEKELGKEIVFVVAKDYNHILTLVEQGNVDIASVSPKLLAILRQQHSKAHYLATIKFINDQGVIRSAYQGLILALNESSIHNISNLKGKSFGFTDIDSTSGYLYPRFIMQQNGIDPNKDLGKTYMLKKHSKIIDALLEKSIDAGAVYDGIYYALPQEKQQKIRIVASSENIPYDAMIASAHLDEALVNKIHDLLLKFHSTQLHHSTIAGFEEKSLSLYDQLLNLESF